jgi:hypothetical protein
MVRAAVRRCLRALLGGRRYEELAGGRDFVRYPGYQDTFGGPLNGSAVRRDAINALHEANAFRAVVETGTFRGDTCEFFADTGLPVYSVEAIPRLYGFARARLRGRLNVRLHRGDSRDFLRRLAVDPSVPKDGVLFYLDAHWSEDLPLREEIELIATHWQNAIIIIDDFQVPGDLGYEFDDYGSGKVLKLAYLDPLRHLTLHAFFPRIPSSGETGLKRGWVALAKGDSAVAHLRASTYLREWSKSGPQDSDVVGA